MRRYLVHLADETVDVLLTVTGVTTLDVVLELASAETTVGVGQLEGPEEVVGLLEVRANGEDLVEEVLHGDNTVLTEGSGNELVVSKGDTLLVDLTVTALVEKLADSGVVGVTVGNVGLNKSEELLGGLGDSEEDTVVDLQKSEKLEGLSGLGGNLVDTLDTDNKDKLGLRGNVERTVSLGSTLLLDDLTLSLVVLLLVGGGFLEENLSLLLVGL